MIYLDNASTTKLSIEAKKEMEKFQDFFWNPSAVYGKGLEVSNKIIESKKVICNELGVSYNDNLLFTASATEANNLAIFGSIRKTKDQLLFSQGEHPSVYNCALELKARGFNVKFIALTDTGKIDFEDLERLLIEPTAFVSVMHVSNETGAINDIKRIVSLVKRRYPSAIFHCDGVQAFGKIPVNVNSLGVDLYTISGHKTHAPKGIGALYVRDLKRLKPIIFGGGQEFGVRSGTENTASIFAFAKVANNLKIHENFDKIVKLNSYVRECFSETTISDKISFNSAQDASPYILSLSFEGVRGETLVHMLEQKDIIIGTGSACSSKKGTLNRTIEAMGKTKIQNEGSVRISFSADNTLDEIKVACERILEAYKSLFVKSTRSK